MRVFRSYVNVSAIESITKSGQLPAKEIAAFSGIANPSGFIDTIETAGHAIKGFDHFPDHHAFTVADIEMLYAKYPDTSFICTEKDAVKIRCLKGVDLTKIFYIKIDARVEPSDAFIVQITKRIVRHGTVPKIENEVSGVEIPYGTR